MGNPSSSTPSNRKGKTPAPLDHVGKDKPVKDLRGANPVSVVQTKPSSSRSLNQESPPVLIPVIDISDAAAAVKAKRAAVFQKIIEANRDYGLFQVSNHGVPEDLMRNAKNVVNGFFSLSDTKKAKFTTDVPQKFGYWKQDTLQHWCHPLESYRKYWPEEPATYRTDVGPYTVKVRELGKKILDLIHEGLGLTKEKFGGCDLTILKIHNYPRHRSPASLCPDDDITVLTLLQHDVYGLELLKDGKWISVKRKPEAFVVSIGVCLEVISNGKLRHQFHRVVTNSKDSRVSLASFFAFPPERKIEPATSVVSPSNPPIFRDFRTKDFINVLKSKKGDMAATMEYFKKNRQPSK